jgi:hypothetical protein
VSRKLSPSARDALLKAAQDALAVQDACNLSGVLLAWARHQAVLREVCGGNSSLEYRHHPVNVLFLSKVLSLLQLGGDPGGGVFFGNEVPRSAFGRAWEEVKQLAERN